MEFQTWSRYWTLFWPKYCARAVPVRAKRLEKTRAARAQRPAPSMRRMLISTACPFFPAGSPRRDPAHGTPGDVGVFPDEPLRCSVFPSSLEIHVVVRRRRHGVRGHPPARDAARHVNETIDAELRLHVLLQQVAAVDAVRRARHRLVIGPWDALLVAQGELVRDLRAHPHDERALAGQEAAVLALELPVGDGPGEEVGQPGGELRVELSCEVIVQRVRRERLRAVRAEPAHGERGEDALLIGARVGARERDAGLA